LLVVLGLVLAAAPSRAAAPTGKVTANWNRPFKISVPGASGGQLDRVDQTTALQPPASSRLGDDEVTLGGFAVAVVTLP
jgi:hypothetical protein